MLDKNQKEQIMRKLENKLSRLVNQVKCPMCGDTHFSLADAYIRNQLQEGPKNMPLKDSSMPSVALICDNCGFISQHAIGILEQ